MGVEPISRFITTYLFSKQAPRPPGHSPYSFGKILFFLFGFPISLFSIWFLIAAQTTINTTNSMTVPIMITPFLKMEVGVGVEPTSRC
jgi:hypothetical protein